MTLLNRSPEHAGRPLHGRTVAVFRHDILALLGLGLVIGLACRGHFAMPHADFPDFVDSGHALLRGELPSTLTRAPVYPLLIAGLGHLLPVEAADVVVAEWLNALLLPINGLLVYLIGRQWFGAEARWAALWFLLLPIGTYCTAHLIVEPLLTGLILLTVLAARRGGGWPYVAAAAATMTRYDAAGLIVGLALADLLRRRPTAQTLRRTALAAAPLAAWLVLTGLTWTDRSDDHYLTQIIERPAFDLGWSLTNVAQTCFDPHMLRLPGWLSMLDPPLNYGLAFLPLLMALVGVVIQLRGKDAGGVAALVALVSYVVVHAVYLYQRDRYGYPPAPIVVLAAGVGFCAAGGLLKRVDPRSVAVRLILLIVGLLLAAALAREARAFATATGGPLRLLGRIGLLALVAIVAVWAAPLVLHRRRLSQMVLLLGLTLLLTTQAGKAAALLGTGQEMKNVVEAARWIRTHTPPEARVLCANPGLLRLYAGRDPPDRFVGFEDIQAETWAEIVVECRRRRIGYVIWHDQLSQLHAAYYAGRLGLSRFDPLAQPDSAEGVRAERWFVKHPTLVIVSVLPEENER